MKKTFEVHIEQDENGVFVGEIPGLSPCYTQAKTIPVLLKRLFEVAQGSLLLQKRDNIGEKSLPLSVSLNVKYA